MNSLAATTFAKDTVVKKNAKSAKVWPMVRLGDVCEVINGLWKGTKEPLVNVGVIRATNFTKQCEFDVTKTVFIDVEEKKFLKRKLQFGDIIVERSGGGPNQPVGRVIYFDQKGGNYSLSNFTSALRVKNSIDLDPYFLYRVLVACYVTGVTEKMQSNSVQLRNIDFERYLNIQIPLPPIEVQKEIVERLEKELGEADKVAAEFKRMVELADTEFKAELEETFNLLSANSAPPREIKNDGCVGFVTRGVAEDAEKCQMVRLGDVCEILDSRRKPITKRDRISGLIPYYGATGIVDYVKDFIFDERLVLLGEDGAKWGSGDRSAFIIEGKAWVNNHAHVLRMSERIFDKFLVYYLNYSDLSYAITGVTVPKLNQQKMCEIQIPLPLIEVQKGIVAKLDVAKERCERLKAEAERGLRAAENLRKAILSEAFE